MSKARPSVRYLGKGMCLQVVSVVPEDRFIVLFFITVF
jgi:hypothetical protein